MILEQWPTMKSAVLIMAHDGGCINRNEPEEVLIKDVELSMLFAGLSRDHFVLIEQDLARLSQSELQTLCIGEQGEAEAIRVFPMTRKLLDVFHKAMS